VRHLRSVRIGILAVTAALLAACGSSGDSGSGGGGGGGDVGEPQSGGSVTLGQQAEPRTLDPATMSNNTSGQTLVGGSLYGQLLTVDADGEVEYGLAESLSSSDGGTTWKLTLREGLTFSDGTPLDAAAVQFGWERILDPTLGSSSRGVVAFIDTMTASGQTLDFTLKTPIAQFENAISEQGPLNWIASPDALRAGATAFDENPIGAGPFVLESWQRSGQMVLTRNESYWDSPRPYLDELVLTANPDADQRYSTVVSGGADGTTLSNPDIFARAEADGLTGHTAPLGGGTGMAMNTRTAPFDDVRARQAVTLGVDRDALRASAYGGEGETPHTFFADGSEWNGDAELLPYDPEAAQELFDELAAEGKPVEFTLTSFPAPQSRRSSESIQAQLSQYDNVQVEVEVLDFPAAIAKLTQRNFQGFISGTAFSAPMPSLYLALYSQSGANSTGVSDPELDSALESALSTTDEDERADAYRQVSERMAELTPEMYYIRQQYSIVVTDSVHGVELYGLGAVRTDGIWTTE
jgi:peptide/nickel transport system substrate-binding protein